MLVGILFAGIISYAIPENLIQNYLGGGLGSMLVMLSVGIPLYICATASTPLAASLISKGMSPGTAFVFPPCRSSNQCSNHNYGRPLPWKTFGCPLPGSYFPLCPWGRIPVRLVLPETWNQCSCNHGNCKRTAS